MSIVCITSSSHCLKVSGVISQSKWRDIILLQEFHVPWRDHYNTYWTLFRSRHWYKNFTSNYLPITTLSVVLLFLLFYKWGCSDTGNIRSILKMKCLIEARAGLKKQTCVLRFLVKHSGPLPFYNGHIFSVNKRCSKLTH